MKVLIYRSYEGTIVTMICCLCQIYIDISGSRGCHAKENWSLVNVFYLSQFLLQIS